MKAWTPDYLAFVLPLTAEAVIPAPKNPNQVEGRAEWVWIQTAQRLAWTYGEAEALRRLNAPPELDAGRLVDRVAA